MPILSTNPTLVFRYLHISDDVDRPIRFSLSIDGRWTARQVHRVIAALDAEAAAQGVILDAIDTTTADGVTWYVIDYHCARHPQHRRPVSSTDSCSICTRVLRHRNAALEQRLREDMARRRATPATVSPRPWWHRFRDLF